MCPNTKTTLFFSTSQKDGMTQAIYKKKGKKSRNLEEPASLHEVMVINEHWHHYQCQWLAEKEGVYTDPERKLSTARCLFMSHHKHWCFKRIRQLSFHRGNEGTASERGTRWLREIKSLRAVKVFSAYKMSWLKCDHLLFKVTSKVIYCGYKQATGYNPYHKLLYVPLF